MRKFMTAAAALSLGAALALSARPAAADAPVTDKMNTISVNPLGLLFGVFNADYERKLGPDHSIDADVSYWSLSFFNYKWTAVGVGGGYKMYFKPVAFDGWYWEPRVDFSSVSLSVSDSILGTTSASGIVFGPGASIGREWVWEGGFMIDAAIGLSYYIGGVTATLGGTDFKAGLSGIGFNGKLGLGYAWK